MCVIKDFTKLIYSFIILWEDEEINRKLTEEEYNEIEEYVFELNLDGYMQDLEENEEQYVPNF